MKPEFTKGITVSDMVALRTMESFLEFIDIVDQATNASSLRDWNRVKPIVRTLLKKRRVQLKIAIKNIKGEM